MTSNDQDLCQCTSCSHISHGLSFLNSCPQCKNGIIEYVIREPIVDLGLDTGIWKHASYLPYFENKYSLGEANTPLIQSNNYFGISSSKVLYKCEFMNPTGTFRDRSAALIASAARTRKEKEIVVASTGSMGVSLAAYSAISGLKCHIFLPEWSESSKKQHILIRGADLRIGGKNFHESVESAAYFANKNGFLNATADQCLLTVEGQKTIAYEIFFSNLIHLENENTCIVVPSSSGSLLYSIYKGFVELKHLGYLKYVPRLVSVQIKDADPFVQSFTGHDEKKFKDEGKSVAPGLFIRNPAFLELSLQAIMNTGGVAISIDSGLILKSIRDFARIEGMCIEPSSILPVIAISELLSRDDFSNMCFIAVLTGSGLAPNPSISEYSRYKESRKSRFFRLSSTKLEIVRILYDGKNYSGKEIWLRLGQVVSHQAVYRHLKDLSGSNYIQSTESPDRRQKLWSITDMGKRELK